MRDRLRAVNEVLSEARFDVLRVARAGRRSRSRHGFCHNEHYVTGAAPRRATSAWLCRRRHLDVAGHLEGDARRRRRGGRRPMP